MKRIIFVVAMLLGLNVQMFAQELLQEQVELVANLLPQKVKPQVSVVDTAYSVGFSGGWVTVGWRTTLVCPTSKDKRRYLIISNRTAEKDEVFERRWERFEIHESGIIVNLPVQWNFPKNSTDLIGEVTTKALNWLLTLPNVAK